MAKGAKYSQQFKEDAVQYRLDHPELSLRKVTDNPGISESALKNWMKATKGHEGSVPTRGSGNYSRDEAKKLPYYNGNYKIQRMLLKCKKQSVFWKTDTSSLYGCF